ncbi:MAG: glycosyltransferase family 39 protein [Verrucomicrobiota bacterium]
MIDAKKNGTPFFDPDGRIWFVVFLITFGFLAASLFHTINVPWVEEDNYYGAIYAQAAHNNLRAGLNVTGGVPVTLYFGPLPIPRQEYYVHHPTLLPLLVTGVVTLFGEREWAVKLIPIACSLLSLTFLWLLVRDTAGRRAAALTAAFFATMPMELHYGDMVDFEPCLVMWMLAALWSLRRWDTENKSRWAFFAGLCCFSAVWTDWPGYLFVSGISLTYLFKKESPKRGFALALLGLAGVSGILFLFQIRNVNPEAWSDLWTAVTLRLGNGVGTGSAAVAHAATAHFTIREWLRSIFHALGEDYLVSSWIFVLAGMIYLGSRIKSSPGLRWIGWATLQMAIAGIPYMLLLRNWSYIHDFASFFAIGSIAILGGLGIEGMLDWIERNGGSRISQPALSLTAVALLIWLGAAGFIRAENQRSQFCILDGAPGEPSNLVPDLGSQLGRIFSQDTTILCNFDPYGSTLPYYAQRTIINNISSADEWKSTAKELLVPAGGVIWTGSPSAAEILEALPKEEISRITVDEIDFAVWKPGQTRQK